MRSELLQIWENYRKIHIDYMLSINQIKVLSLTAGQVFSDFPKRLPENIRKPLMANLQEFLRLTGKKLKKKEEIEIEITTHGFVPKLNGEKVEYSKDDRDRIIGNTLFISTIMMGFTKAQLDKLHKTKFKISHKIDFERVLYFQELVMNFSYLNAFVDDSLRVICKICPEILKRSKKIEWNAIISCGSWEKIMDHLIERFVREDFSYKSVIERVELLRKEIGLKINYPKNSLSFLEEAELFRNLIVHNFGRINNQYIRKSGRTDLNVDMVVPVTFAYVDKLSYESQLLASIIFKEIALNFFKIPDSSPELDFVWRPKQKRR